MVLYIKNRDFSNVQELEALLKAEPTKIEITHCSLPKCKEITYFTRCKHAEKMVLFRNALNSDKIAQFPSEIKYLKITDCQLKSVDINAFQLCSISISYLDLSNNYLEQLDANTFRFCLNLKLINLANNRLNTLPADIFRDCEQLQTLNLASNRLSSICKETFSSCLRLKRIDLSNNQISNLNESVRNKKALLSYYYLILIY